MEVFNYRYDNEYLKERPGNFNVAVIVWLHKCKVKVTNTKYMLYLRMSYLILINFKDQNQLI